MTTTRKLQASLTWLVIISSYTDITAIKVYDCADSNVRIQELDLLQPAACPSATWDFEVPEDRVVQLLQTDADVSVEGYQCLVTISSDATYCGGYDSITYSSVPTSWEEVLPISQKDCLKAAKVGTLRVGKKSFAVGLNEIMRTTFYSHGNATADGKCTAANFVSNGVTFTKHYELTRITIQLVTVWGTYTTEEARISFPHLDGLTAMFDKGYVFDAQHGAIAWDQQELGCGHQLSQIYRGKAELRKKREGDITGAIVMIADKITEQYIGLVLQAPVLACETICYNTQLRGVVACLLSENEDALNPRSFRPGFDQSAKDFGAQVAFQVLKGRIDTHRSFHEVATALCSLQRQLFHTKLQAIASGSGPYALLDLYGPGHAFTVAGAVAYVTTCVEKTAIKAEYPNCTAEIPVSINNTIFFIDPFTFVMNEVATIVPCSSVTPVKWKIAGQWKCSTPRMVDCQAPMRLNTTITLRQPTSDMTKGLGKGMYSPAQLLQHKAYMRALSSRGPATQKIANVFAKSVHGGTGFGIDDDDLFYITNSVGFMFFPLFYVVGRAYTYVIASLIIFYILKTLLCMLWRIVVVSRRRGCGWWLILALIDTGFVVAQSPFALIEQTITGLIQAATDDDESRAVRTMEANLQRARSKIRDASTAAKLTAHHAKEFASRKQVRMKNLARPIPSGTSHEAVTREVFEQRFPEHTPEYIDLIKIHDERKATEDRIRDEDSRADLDMLMTTLELIDHERDLAAMEASMIVRTSDGENIYSNDDAVEAEALLTAGKPTSQVRAVQFATVPPLRASEVFMARMADYQKQKAVQDFLQSPEAAQLSAKIEEEARAEKGTRDARDSPKRKRGPRPIPPPRPTSPTPPTPPPPSPPPLSSPRLTSGGEKPRKGRGKGAGHGGT